DAQLTVREEPNAATIKPGRSGPSRGIMARSRADGYVGSVGTDRSAKGRRKVLGWHMIVGLIVWQGSVYPPDRPDQFGGLGQRVGDRAIFAKVAVQQVQPLIRLFGFDDNLVVDPDHP